MRRSQILRGAVAGLVLFAACDTARDESSTFGTLAASGLLTGERVALSAAAAVLGAPGSAEALVFPRSGSAWGTPTTLRPEGTDLADPAFGQAVAIDDAVAVFGAVEWSAGSDASGEAYVFEREGGTWSRSAVLAPDDLAPRAQFGAAVSVSGERAVVSSANEPCPDPADGICGRVHVFTRDASGWSRSAVLDAPEPGTTTVFGIGVALDGDRLAVASLYGLTGRTYCYAWDGSAWQPDGVLDAPPLPDGSLTPFVYGADMDLDGTTLVVSEPGRAGGTVYVYRRGGTWELEATLQYGRGVWGPLASFGNRVSLDGDRLVVSVSGREYDGDNRGAAVVFARTSGAWTQEAELRPSSGVDGFARDVAIEEDVVVVGRNDADTARGGAFVFRRSTDGTWREE